MGNVTVGEHIRSNSWHCAVPTLDLYEQLDVTTFNSDRISACKQLFHETWPSKFFSSTCQWRLTNTRPRSHVNVARSHGWYSAQWRACQQRRGRRSQVINKKLIHSYSGPCAFSSSYSSATLTCTWSLCPRALSKECIMPPVYFQGHWISILGILALKTAAPGHCSTYSPRRMEMYSSGQ